MLKCRPSAVCRPSCVAVFVNMASHKSLTDDDLRKKLKEYGITSPVTATTRNILIKKLNHVIASQKKVSAASTRSKRASTASQLNTFSSDEDEDNDTSVHSQANRSFKFLRNKRGSRGNTDITVNNKNYSISCPQLSRTSGRQGRPSSSSSGSGMREDVCREPSGGGVSVLARSDSYSEAAHGRTAYYPVSARSGISPRAKIHDDYDTGSDSDLADGDDSLDTSARMGPTSYLWNNNRESEVLPNNNSYKAPTYQNHTSSVSCDRSFSVSDVASRSRKVNSFLENGDYDRDCLEDGASFLGVAESIVTHASPGNHEQVRVANGRHHSESSQHLDHSHSVESTWHYSVPLLLLILLAVFFGVVGMLYVNMRMPLLPTLCSVPAMVHQAMANVPVPFLTFNEPESQAKDDVAPQSSHSSPLTTSHHTSKAPPPPEPAPPHASEIKFPVCNEKTKIEQIDCLTVQEIGSVQPLLGRLEDVLLPALHRHAGLYQCGDTLLKYIPIDEIKDLFNQQDSSQELSCSVEGINALGKLVELNSHWGLEAVRGENKALLGLSLSSQPTYILCHITTAIYSFFYMLMGIITVILTAWLAFYCVRYHKRKAEEEKQQVYELIEQILEVLGGVGIPAGKDYVAVNHVRDSLISPRDRRVKKRLWEKAVQFIDHYESRVLREIQEVGGEDCEVWRWASGVPHSPGNNSLAGDGGAGRPPAKMWQGPAFDNLGPHNVPNVSPTSCLKIRNMFDCDVEFGDSWPSRIQDSILEKCEGVSIVHIAVDRGSREGCVYLKCASLSEAGRAFRALHGWWYDGNLVTVKFLRDERYHQRFPSARHATRRLRPSNNKRLSLQVPTGQPEASKHT
nr:uncharacterized protein LOC123771121 isoform X1 [Procambarus clarkii]